MQYLIETSLNLELFDEAYDYSFKLIEINNLKLNEEQRNLFMRSAKSKFNFFRNAWKNLLDYEQSEAEVSSTIPKELIDKHLLMLEKSIREFCLSMDTIVEKLLENISENDKNAYIFYKKLKADYLRYLSEVANEQEFLQFAENCRDIYQEAYNKCGEYLEPNSALTLSVALNYSLFTYFILDDIKKAFNIADKAYKQAMIKLTDQKIPEVESLIKNIEENLTIWKIELFDTN